MKKRTLTCLLGLGAASFLMLSGFDSAATSEDVMDKYIEAGSKVESYSVNEKMDSTISINIPSYQTTMGISVAMDVDAGFMKEPLKLAIEGNMKYSMMGQNQDVSVTAFLVQDGDEINMYSRSSDGTETEAAWSHETMDPESAKQFLSLLTSDQLASFDYKALGIEWALAPAAVDVNGTSCYQLTTTLTFDDLLEVMKNAGSMAGLEDSAVEEMTSELDGYKGYLQDLRFNMEVDINDETYLPAKLVLDMDGTDWSAISEIAAALIGTGENDEPVEIEITTENLAITALYDYDTPVVIEVPAEALAVPAEGTTGAGDLSGVLGGLAG